MNTKSKKILAGVGMLALASVALFGTANAASIPAANRSARPSDSVRQAIDAAITANDYTAFKSATASAPKPADAPEITEAVFAKIVEAQKLRAAGDEAGARAIMESLGFKGPGKHLDGKHGIPPNLTGAQKAAFEQAKALRDAGKLDEAKAVLDAAGIKPPARPVKQVTTTS